MKSIFAIALSLATVAMPVTAAQAATTVNLSTGQGAKGAVDPIWDVRTPSNATLNAVIATSVPGTWNGGSANPEVNGARWVTPALPGTNNQPIGIYEYSTVFALSGLSSMPSPQIIGKFWADNLVRSILINGVSIYSNLGNDSQFTSANGVNFGSSGKPGVFFIEGNNTLSVFVQNTTQRPSPQGLRVSAVFTAVPEPGTWMLMMLGLGAIGFSMRSRKNQRVSFA